MLQVVIYSVPQIVADPLGNSINSSVHSIAAQLHLKNNGSDLDILCTITAMLLAMILLDN